MEESVRDQVVHQVREANSILKRYAHYTLAPLEALDHLSRIISALPTSVLLLSAYSESSNSGNYAAQKTNINNHVESQLHKSSSSSSSPHFPPCVIARTMCPLLTRVGPFLHDIIATRNAEVSSRTNSCERISIPNTPIVPLLLPHAHHNSNQEHGDTCPIPTETDLFRDNINKPMHSSTGISALDTDNDHVLMSRAKSVRSVSPRSPLSLHCQPSSPKKSSTATAVLRSKRVSHPPTLKQVVGCEEAKLSLRQTIVLPSRFPQLFESRCAPQRVLLYGPPGTGKTLLAQAVASETQHQFFTYSAADLLSKFMGESEKQIRDIFTTAAKKCSCTASGATDGVILFFDEVDALCSARGTREESETSRRIKTQFLFQLQQLPPTVKVVAATNLPWELDSAVSRRFDRMIYVGVPSSKERLELLSRTLCEARQSLSLEIVERISIRMQGFTASDIVLVVNQALSKSLEAFNTADAVRPATAADLEACGVVTRKRRRAARMDTKRDSVWRGYETGGIKKLDTGVSHFPEKDSCSMHAPAHSAERPMVERECSEDAGSVFLCSPLCAAAVRDDSEEEVEEKVGSTPFFAPCHSSHPNALHSVGTQQIPSAQLLVRYVNEADFHAVLDNFIPSVTEESVKVFENFLRQKK